jgi:hypothetical protein
VKGVEAAADEGVDGDDGVVVVDGVADGVAKFGFIRRSNADGECAENFDVVVVVVVDSVKFTFGSTRGVEVKG